VTPPPTLAVFPLSVWSAFVDSAGNPMCRPAVCADNHYDAVPTPPKHRGSYWLQPVNLPKVQHLDAIGQCAHSLREWAHTCSSTRTEISVRNL